MKLSARNVLKGKVIEVKKGATTAHVRIQLSGGAIITSSITNEAVEELRLATGEDAYAVIKASDVMVGRLILTREAPPRLTTGGPPPTLAAARDARVIPPRPAARRAASR
jgi:molybdopterin-binding protein